MKKLLVFGVCLVAAGCISTREEAASAHFVCENGADLRVQFREGEAVVTLPDNASLVLKQQISGSGFRYSDGLRELSGKGDEAIWEADGHPATRCKAV